MRDIVFLYDQVVEHMARLSAFYSVRERVAAGDVQDDIDLVSELLAKRDLLTLAASARNFAETAGVVGGMKKLSMPMCCILTEPTPPFFKTIDQRVSLYQILSRILHASEIKILRSGLDFALDGALGEVDVIRRAAPYMLLTADKSKIEPIIVLITDRDPHTSVQLHALLCATCDFMNVVSDYLSEKKVFLQRSDR